MSDTKEKTQSTYSWMGTKLHLVLDDGLAGAYNRATTAFFEAQKNHKLAYGTSWHPTDPLAVSWTEEEQNAWNNMAEFINSLVALNGGFLDITEEEMTSNYLEKIEVEK